MESVEEMKRRKRRTDGKTIQNDAMSDSEFKQFLLKVFKNAYDVMKPGAPYYVWYASKEHVNFETSLNETGMQVRQQLIWNKNRLVLGRQDYQWKHEPCLYGWKEGAAHYFIDNRALATVFEDEAQDFKKMKKEELVQLLEDIYSEKVPTTIIDEARPGVSDIHPTMKPLKLIARNVRNSSKQGQNVLDIFGGSGSTLMVCEQLDRRCYTMELDPKYCDAIIKRWEDFTGKQAKRLTK